MTLPEKLPVGIEYPSKFHGATVQSEHEGKLIYWWGAKGHCGMEARPVYMIPILGGHVCEYVDAEPFLTQKVLLMVQDEILTQ